MNEQTKIELLKIAATLTTAYAGNSGTSDINVKIHFEGFCFYLFNNLEQLGEIEVITQKPD